MTTKELARLARTSIWAEAWGVIEVELAEPRDESGTMSDYEWLTVQMVHGTLVGRVRGQYPKGYWSSWYYIYSPVEVIMLPEQMERMT